MAKSSNLPARLRDAGPTFRFGGVDYPLTPKLQALPSDKMRAFVIAYSHLVNPSQIGSQARAAGMAGYETEYLSQQAHALLHDDRILEAIREQDIKRLGVIGSKAIKALEAQVDSPTSKHHAKAVEMALERYIPSSKYIHHTHETVQSPEDEALQLYRDLKAAGTSQEVLEHTFGAIGVARYERLIGGEHGAPKRGKSKKLEAIDVEFTSVGDTPNDDNPEDW